MSHHLQRFGIHLALRTACALVAFGFLATGLAQLAQAQTFRAISTFNGGSTGGSPSGGLVMDRRGALYGSTEYGGATNLPQCQLGANQGCGVIFQVKPTGSGWVLNPLYTFQGAADGAVPQLVVFGPDGNLYGMTNLGGSCAVSQFGCGTVFKLSPGFSVCKTVLCPWVKTTLYNFAGGNDGMGPFGPVTFGPDGSIYGEVRQGGAYNSGIVFKLTRTGGGWTESVIYTFTDGADGSWPLGGVVLDGAGDVYGTTYSGGDFGAGTVFELMPSGTGWTFEVLNQFTGFSDGGFPNGGVIFDASGNLLGPTTSGGSSGGGVVFQLVPGNDTWTENVLYNFDGLCCGGPFAGLSMDANGALYGTTWNIPSAGAIFKLAPSNGGWTETNLHVFDIGPGSHPASTVLIDGSGNLFGTTYGGGAGYCNDLGCGIVWEITP